MDIQQHTSIQYHPKGCKKHNKGKKKERKKERKQSLEGRKLNVFICTLNDCPYRQSHRTTITRTYKTDQQGFLI